MLDRTDQLIAEFTDSRQFEGLTRYQRREAEFVIENVGEFLAAYEGVPIDEPDSQSLDFVCTRLYPAKVSAEPDHFGAVAPVLAAFLRFLDARGYRDDGEALAAHVEDLEDKIVEAAADPANWGLAKSLVMSGEIDEAITSEEIEDSTGELHRLDLPEDIDPLDAIDPTTSPSSPTDPIPGTEPQGRTQGMQFSAE